MSDYQPPQQPPYNQGPPQGPYQLPQNQDYQGYYSPSQYPPQYIQPARKSRKGLWIVLAVIAIMGIGLCGIISVAMSSASKSVATSTTTDTTMSSSAPTSTGKWTTTHTFTGNGAKKTATFSVGSDWKIVYSCSGMDIGGTTADANLIVSVNNSDSTPVDPAAINAICKAGKTISDNTEEHTSGNVYLDVNADAAWSIQIQELK